MSSVLCQNTSSEIPMASPQGGSIGMQFDTFDLARNTDENHIKGAHLGDFFFIGTTFTEHACSIALHREKLICLFTCKGKSD